PDLALLPPNPRLYARASRALHEILRVYAPVIEPRGFGHSFLDLTGTERLFGPAVEVAERIRREAGERLRLPLSAGVAVNKLVSEAATRVGRTGGQADWRSVGSVLPPDARAEYRISHTLATATNDLGVLHRLLRRLTESLGRRLRRRGLAAGRLVLRVEYADFDDDARSVPLAAQALDGELWDAAKLA